MTLTPCAVPEAVRVFLESAKKVTQLGILHVGQGRQVGTGTQVEDLRGDRRGQRNRSLLGDGAEGRESDESGSQGEAFHGGVPCFLVSYPTVGR